MSVVWGKGMRRCIPFYFCSVFYVCCFGLKGMRRCIPLIYVCCLGEGNAQMHSILYLFSLFMSVVLGGRECADAFHLISVLSFYVCCLGGRECADAFHLISALSFYVFCFGGKGMRRCIPFDFCSVFLCLLF